MIFEAIIPTDKQLTQLVLPSILGYRKMKKVIFSFLSYSNAEAFTAALTQEGFQVRWLSEDEDDTNHIWVEVIVPEKNIKN